jgi:hypothetical protein
MPALMSACVVVVVAMVAAINLALPKLSGSSLEPTSKLVARAGFNLRPSGYER